MKYAFFVLFTLILTFFSSKNVSARSISAFHDSAAISTVAQYLYDVAEDLPVSTRLNDKKLNIKDFSQCTDVTSAEVIADFEQSIKSTRLFYPDDEVPFEQAIADMEDYLDSRVYKKCMFVRKTPQSKVQTAYYTDVNDKIHLRLDSVALRVE